MGPLEPSEGFMIVGILAVLCFLMIPVIRIFDLHPVWAVVIPAVILVTKAIIMKLMDRKDKARGRI